jgi:hypothetical protein
MLTLRQPASILADAFNAPMQRRAPAGRRIELLARSRAATASELRAGCVRQSPSSPWRRSRSLARVVLLVQTGSGVGVDEGGCSPSPARARCACGLSRIRPAASTPAAPAIAAKQVRGTAAHDAGVADEATGCASGEMQVDCGHSARHPLSRCRASLGQGVGDRCAPGSHDLPPPKGRLECLLAVAGVGRVDVDAWPDDFVDAVEQCVVEGDVGGPQLLDRSGSDDC